MILDRRRHALRMSRASDRQAILTLKNMPALNLVLYVATRFNIKPKYTLRLFYPPIHQLGIIQSPTGAIMNANNRQC